MKKIIINNKYKLDESHLGDYLKPKSKDEILKNVLSIEDPDKLLNIAVNKVKDPQVVKIAIEKGADLNKLIADNIIDPEILRTILTTPSEYKFIASNIIYKSLKFKLEKEIIALLKSNRLDISSKRGKILYWAIGFTLENLVKEILKNSKGDILSTEDSLVEALCVAIARGNYNIVKMLLDDKRIDPSISDNRLLNVAIEFNNKKVKELLLKDKRVLNKYNNNMKKIVKESLMEDAVMAEPTVKPGVKPGIKPGTRPGAPSPIRRERPSVTPGPKASAEDVAKKFLDLIK